MLNNLLNVGRSALNASQAWLSVTGNNIANADTEGYSRRYVDQRDAGGITRFCGEEGMGVNAQQVLRYFDDFLERSYLGQFTESERWNEHDNVMESLESIFNEANTTGIHSTLSQFFSAWNQLSLRPEETASRSTLLAYGETFSDILSSAMRSIRTIQEEMDLSINTNVDRINEISSAIADLNRQIGMSTIDQVNTPNSLLDQRDQLVRELSGLIDIETIDHGKGDFRVQLGSGQPLTDGITYYELEVREPSSEAENRLLAGSQYKGKVEFAGTDEHEYTLEILDGATQYRVSLDGGKTWLKDANNEELVFNVNETSLVKNLEISFSTATGLSAGDKFDIVPKRALYWIEPTRGAENVTPQIDFSGTDNPNRVTGGKIAAWFNIRDDNCGRYIDEMDAVASTLIWEVNRLHSQGVGLEKLSGTIMGQEDVGNADAALGTAESLTPFYDKLSEGNINFYFYNSVSGAYLGTAQLDFSNLNTGKINFDPQANSLNDVVNVINNYMVVRNSSGEIVSQDENGNPISPFQASVENNRLVLTVNSAFNGTNNPTEFALGVDTTGLMAALGINTFFKGSSAETLEMSSNIRSNYNLVASAHVDANYDDVVYQVNEGDNSIATAIGALAEKNVTISTFWKTVSNQSLTEYYANLVTTVGADKKLAATNSEYHTALASDLQERIASVSGVNLDEEMSNLIKYQHSYTAAAKLITTADEMLQTLLGIKQ